jgi:hypothetical protein
MAGNADDVAAFGNLAAWASVKPLELSLSCKYLLAERWSAVWGGVTRRGWYVGRSREDVVVS